MIVRASAPLRVSFAGGGTDVAPFPETDGGVVLSATINRYVSGALHPRNDSIVSVESADSGVAFEFGLHDQPPFNGQLDLVKAAVRRFSAHGSEGYDLILRSAAPVGSGLGASSTFTVVLAGLLSDYYQLPMTRYEIAQLAWRIERSDVGVLGGLQDHYAAAFGGLNLIEFGADRTVVHPLRLRDSVTDELQASLLLCYTGATRESARIIADQATRVRGQNASALTGLRAQKELAIAMKAALLRGGLGYFGELLGEAWAAKKKISPMISTPQIEEAYEVAMRRGATGGKVTGAGGGGHILFYCDSTRKHHVAEALEKLGMTASEFRFEWRGLTTWRA